MRNLVIVALMVLAAAVDGKEKHQRVEEHFAQFQNDEDIKLITDDDDRPPTKFEGDVQKAQISNIKNTNAHDKFKYNFETQNGINIVSIGKLKDKKTFVVTGSYAYTGADGKRYRVRYTADELGYHPFTELDTEPPVIITTPPPVRLTTRTTAIPFRSTFRKQSNSAAKQSTVGTQSHGGPLSSNSGSQGFGHSAGKGTDPSAQSKGSHPGFGPINGHSKGASAQNGNSKLSNGANSGHSIGSPADRDAQNQGSNGSFGGLSNDASGQNGDSKLMNGADGDYSTDPDSSDGSGDLLDQYKNSNAANGPFGGHPLSKSTAPSSSYGNSKSIGSNGGRRTGSSKGQNQNSESTNGAIDGATANGLANGSGQNKEVPTLQSLLERMNNGAPANLFDRFGEPGSAQRKFQAPGSQYLPPHQYLPPVSKTYLPAINEAVPQAMESPDLLPPIVIL